MAKVAGIATIPNESQLPWAYPSLFQNLTMREVWNRR